MSTILSEIASKVQRLPESFDRIIGEELSSNPALYAQELKTQLDQGLDARQERIVPKYAKFTIKKKKKKGQIFDKVTLQDTGETLKTLKVNVLDGGDFAVVSPETPQAEELIKKYNKGKQQPFAIGGPALNRFTKRTITPRITNFIRGFANV